MSNDEKLTLIELVQNIEKIVTKKARSEVIEELLIFIDWAANRNYEWCKSSECGVVGDFVYLSDLHEKFAEMTADDTREMLLRALDKAAKVADEDIRKDLFTEEAKLSFDKLLQVKKGN